MEVIFMSINGINNVTPATTRQTTPTKAPVTKKENTTAKAENTSGVIYEKSTDTVTQKNSVKDNAAIIAKMKADAEERTAQLRSLVEQMISKQGATIAAADDIWKFLAKGDFTVTPEVKAQAQADIAEDGYWGVEKTSERILEFAKALSGDDPKKADLLLNAFKKGFEEATKAWGDELPEISQKTYDAVVEKFEAWKNEAGEE